MWPIRTISYFVFFWVACLMSLVNPIWGVVNYLMVYQSNPTNTWWGLPLADLGMRFSLLAAIFIFLGLLTARKQVPVIRPAFSFWEFGVLCLLGISAIHLLLNTQPSPQALAAFEKFWKMLLFVLVFGRLVSTRRNIRIVLWTFVLGSLYVGWDAYTAPPSAFWLGRLERIGGPDFSTTSGTAAHLSAMLPLIGVAFLISRNWYWRIFALGTAAFTVNAIVLCRTRSAFVGLACGAAVALLATPRVKRYRIHFLLGIGVVIAFSFTDIHFWNRMSTLTDRHALSTDAATVSRTDIWKSAVRILQDQPLGVGTGNFPAVIGDYDSRYYKRSTHNTLVVCFTELGYAGGIILLLLAMGALRLLRLSARHAKETDDPEETTMMIYGFLISFVTYFVTGLGTERFYCESFWWVMILPLCVNRMVMREATQALPVLEPEPLSRQDEYESVMSLPHGT